MVQNGTVGIRVLNSPASLQVIESLGRPVTATSLNESGKASTIISAAEPESLNWPEGEVVQVS